MYKNISNWKTCTFKFRYSYQILINTTVIHQCSNIAYNLLINSILLCLEKHIINKITNKSKNDSFYDDISQIYDKLVQILCKKTKLTTMSLVERITL